MTNEDKSNGSSVEERLAVVGLRLPAVAAPLAAYIPAVMWGDLVFTAGQVPRRDGSVLWPGKVGADVTVNQAREAAEVAALQALAAVKQEVESLDAIARIVKVTVFVNSGPGFVDQPQVADAASELMRVAFGDCGRHSRSAVGVAELPLNSCVELELVAAVLR